VCILLVFLMYVYHDARFRECKVVVLVFEDVMWLGSSFVIFGNQAIKRVCGQNSEQ
jgi:hypothetical protein